MIALRIAGIIIGIWAGIRLGKIGIAWLKQGFKKLEPPRDDY